MTEQGAQKHRILMSDYDYYLPEELIAQVPLEDRAASRLMVLNRQTGDIVHSMFRQLAEFLLPGDLLVFNDSRVIPARLRIMRKSGGAGELLLLQSDDATGEWKALGRPARRLRAGETVTVLPAEDGAIEASGATIAGRDESGLLRVCLDPEVESDLDAYGSVPLPPYITAELRDRERYQTVYSHDRGSAAAPTAGLHFTEETLAALRKAGVATAFVTLHVGLDTFRPVTAEYAEDHQIHTEWCSVSEEAIRAIRVCKARGGRVVAVGTTSARTIETLGRHLDVGDEDGFSGPTDIFITPGYEWKVVDGLFTNFHLPKSTLMLMVSALAGRDRIMRAYAEAIAERYRFFSFGDAMLII
ncbi:MAG TPA: tRNA preQ1(34) S-adenosylmethionine ribosyltransferase-isomerase QueA [Thermomicrobiales bacterium]|nr:tRNA preQ1(34) S-adenosylmethionine ribosyltransferase-isomerase QueA [Thermomicrobiales bacterium]